MIRNIKSFSVAEMIVITILVGILAAAALPNYVKSLEKAAERTAIGNLLEIRGAVKFYIINSGGDIPDMADLNTINNALGLRISDPLMTYNCVSANNQCYANHPKGWTVHFHINPGFPEIIHCMPADNCPSCPASHATGCG